MFAVDYCEPTIAQQHFSDDDGSGHKYSEKEQPHDNLCNGVIFHEFNAEWLIISISVSQ